jgi:hypothetical protein
MPFDKEFQHHLHEVMASASLEVRDEVERHKRELLFNAQQTHNGAAMPIAYSDAAIYSFKTRTQRVIDGYFQALDDCGILIDASVESEMLKLIGALTSAKHALTFPPGLRGPQLVAVQQEHARETMRVGNQLQRDAANRLRAAKMKNAQNASSAAKPAPEQKPVTEAGSLPAVKVGQTFVSYSWESEEHQNWVLSFATTLRHNGVDVVLDQWHLPPGDDMYLFMERSVRSAEFVMIVCTPAYAAKADARIGGVGYEARIITTQLAQQTDQRKFIPILRKGDYSSATPIWLASRRGLDFSATPYSSSEFQRLLRTLHREEIQAPELGSKPVFPELIPPDERVAVSGGVSREEPKHLALGNELNHAERELLDAAVNDPASQISHRRPIGPDQLITNERNFIERGDPRSAAKWLGALESLQRKGLVRATSYEKHFYTVTQQGYDLAEQLGPFVRWTTSEVLLQALFFGNRPAESMTLKCSRLIEVPPVFYEDQYGADGRLMRSLKQRRALLVEGIDPLALDILSFEPTDVQFKNAATNEIQSFRVSRGPSADRKTLLLEING